MIKKISYKRSLKDSNQLKNYVGLIFLIIIFFKFEGQLANSVDVSKLRKGSLNGTTFD